MSFDYRECSTEDVAGRRFYHLPTASYPSITTMLGYTLPPEDEGWLAAWRARVGHEEADRISLAATTRGTNVHLMLERACNGDDPKLAEFPEAHQAIFKSMKFLTKKITKVYGQEVVLYSHAFELAGRCDCVGEWEGVPSIIDFKTASRPKSLKDIQDYWLQTTFYALAHNEMFSTDIKQLVIFIGVADSLPQVFKAPLTDVLIEKLALRTEQFYEA